MTHREAQNAKEKFVGQQFAVACVENWQSKLGLTDAKYYICQYSEDTGLFHPMHQEPVSLKVAESDAKKFEANWQATQPIF